MNTSKQEFAIRLKKAMEKAGYKPEAAVLERGFNQHYYGEGVTIQGVNKWLKAQSIPKHDKVIAIAKWLKVEPSDLIFGLEVNKQITQEKASWKEAINYQEREVFEVFLNLPAHQKKVVREVILAFKLAYPNN
jgi:transcriptional regulator with XRE-family HTH domain